MIRTSGEHRISNFLLWQLAYSELVFDRRAVARLPSGATSSRRSGSSSSASAATAGSRERVGRRGPPVPARTATRAADRAPTGPGRRRRRLDPDRHRPRGPVLRRHGGALGGRVRPRSPPSWSSPSSWSPSSGPTACWAAAHATAGAPAHRPPAGSRPLHRRPPGATERRPIRRRHRERPGGATPGMTLFRDQGMVLRTIRLGEADRIVTLMTEQHGKVRAVAKGVRRTSSKFGSRLEPLSHVALLGWQGRGDLDIVNQVEVIDTYRPVREDLDRMARGHVHAGGGRPGRPGAPRQPPALRDAGRGRRRPGRAGLGDGGAGLLPARCWPSRDRPRCSTPACRAARRTPTSWSPSTWSRAACSAGAAGGAGRVTPEALALLRRILGGGLAGVLAEPRSPVTDEVTALATEAMEAHLDRRLRSVRSRPVS